MVRKEKGRGKSFLLKQNHSIRSWISICFPPSEELSELCWKTYDKRPKCPFEEFLFPGERSRNSPLSIHKPRMFIDWLVGVIKNASLQMGWSFLNCAFGVSVTKSFEHFADWPPISILTPSRGRRGGVCEINKLNRHLPHSEDEKQVRMLLFWLGKFKSAPPSKQTSSLCP